jgi:hypothetical protein
MGKKDTSMTRTVEDANGSDLQTTVELDMANGGWKLRLITQAEAFSTRPAWLDPATAQTLIDNLTEQLAEARTRNLEAFGYTEGPA